MNDLQRVESATSEEGCVLLTVFDGQEIVSVELLDSSAAVTADSCAVALGFGTLLEDC